MNQREQQHGIHTLYESLCASVYLCYQNSWAIITELTRHRTSTPSLLVLSTLSICLSALSMCLSVSCPFTFTLPLILTVMTSGMVSCVYFLSITRSSTVLSYSLDRGSSQNMGKKNPIGILYLLLNNYWCFTGYVDTSNRNLLYHCSLNRASQIYWNTVPLS